MGLEVVAKFFRHVPAPLRTKPNKVAQTEQFCHAPVKRSQMTISKTIYKGEEGDPKNRLSRLNSRTDSPSMVDPIHFFVENLILYLLAPFP